MQKFKIEYKIKKSYELFLLDESLGKYLARI